MPPESIWACTGRSSSSTVTLRLAVTLPYPPPDAVWVRVNWSSVRFESSAAVKVTVCGVLQFPVVKVRDVESTVTVELCPEIATVTFPVGALPRRTVYLDPPPSSCIVRWLLLNSTLLAEVEAVQRTPTCSAGMQLAIPHWGLVLLLLFLTLLL